MKDLATVNHHPMVEEIVDVLQNKTQNTDRGFFRVMTAYFLAKMASSVRATIITKDRGSVPVNVYALSLAVSGSGKGYSVNIIEEELLRGFKNRFINDSFEIMSQANLWKIAKDRALRKGTDEQTEKDAVDAEFSRAGALAFTFDSGTSAAVKQMRHKMLLANAGSLNLQIDEIGSNLIGSTELLNVYLELYDQGIIKNKLTKNTAENQRNEEVDGKTPTNMLLFGTPSKLLDGGKTEDEFYSFLETGYARRCLFAYGHRLRAADILTPAEIYRRMSSQNSQAIIDRLSAHFTMLADPAKFNWKIFVDDAVGVELLTYRIECERLADSMPEHEEIKKAELSHRYFKVLKLAGAYAFIDESSDLTMDHLYQAIKLVEESGAAFEKIFTREKNYVKLAKYLAGSNTELTHADLNESLPFYKGSMSTRNEMMQLAMAWGYKNHIIIKKSFMEGIEFFRGETLKEVNLEKVRISYSDHMAYNYLTEEIPFSKLHQLTQLSGYHWINHGLTHGGTGAGHRTEENVLPGFDLVCVDVDKGMQLEQAKELLKEYSYLIYTTKRHDQDQNHRFRIIMPMNYRLDLDAEEYKEFMSNVFSWLPFDVDTQTNQRARKWESFDGNYFYNEGEPLDALRFIPKTSRNEEYKASIVKLENLDNLERWFAQRMLLGNRNNQFLRFAMMLVDSGFTYQEIENKVLEFNNKLDNRLPEDELRQTVLVTVARKMIKNQQE